MGSNSRDDCIRKVTKYDSVSDDDGGAALKSQYFITMQHGKVANEWTNIGNQETIITNQTVQSEKQTTQNRSNLRHSSDITAHKGAKKRGVDEQTLGEAHTTPIEINRVQKKTVRRKRRKKETRPISTTGIRLSDHVLSEIAAEQSPWALARFGQLSQKTLILCKGEMRRRLKHKIVDVQYYLSNGETYIHRDHCESLEYIERICSLMEFILACDVKITGFRHFPPILWNIAVPIPRHITRRFEEAFSHCFTHLPVVHLESISPRALSTAVVLKVAALSSSRISSVDLIISDQTEMKELAFISRLENIEDLTLKVRSPCPIFACKHGRRSQMAVDDGDEENSLWPKTLRFTSLQKMRRFRIIIFDYDENDLWRCSYLKDEFSLMAARSSGNKKCSMLSLMPSLVSLSLPCAPPKLMRRACACDSKLRQLVIGTYHRDLDTAMPSAKTTIVEDVLAMFFNIRHWKSFDPKKICLEEIKLIMDCIRFPNHVFAIADLEILLEMIYETCHRLRRLDIVLSLPLFVAPLASSTLRGMCRSLITHFTLRVPWMDGGYLNFAAAASTCLKVLPDTVESIGISVRTESVNCVTSFLTIISSLESISRFSCLDAVHFQINGLPCFELLLMQVSHSLETASEVSILSSPLCRDKNELLSNLKIFVGRMRNLRVLRVDEEFTRLIFDGKAARRSDLRELCTEIRFKGVILIGAAPDLEEWNNSISSILPHTMDRDCLLHLFSVYMEMAELHPDIPWKIPNLAAYSFTEETIRNFHRQNISEPHIDESSSDEEESSEDTVSFITEDVQYDTEMDELEKAEFQLASDGSIDDDFDGGSDESDEAEEEEYSESNGSPLEEVGDEEYEELEEEDESYSHNSFIDSEAEEEQEVEEHESDQDSQGNSDSNEEGVLDGMFDESALESTSDEDVELADLVMNPQKRVVRRKIIISESDGDC